MNTELDGEIAARELFLQVKDIFAIPNRPMAVLRVFIFNSSQSARIIPNKLTLPSETEPVTCLKNMN